jgi:hypothetical protein
MTTRIAGLTCCCVPMAIKWTKDEAIDILAQVSLLRESADALEKQALEVLKRPELRIVECDSSDSSSPTST